MPNTPVSTDVKGLIPICMPKLLKYRFAMLRNMHPIKLFKTSLTAVLNGAEHIKDVHTIITAPSK